MYHYKRLMVALSLGENDESSIRYTALISRLAESEKIYFVHVVSSLDVPEYLHADYPHLIQPVDETTREQMEKLVSKYFDGHSDAKLEYEVAEGSPQNELLRWSKNKEIDLLIIGKRRDPREGGTLPVRVARKAPCSVLIVPECAEAKVSGILVAVDFSENSADAMEVGIAFASASGREGIQCLHVYSVPTGFHKTGKTYEEFAEIMKGHAENHYQEFISKMDCKNLTATPIFKLGHKIAEVIAETIGEHQIDLVAIGARGRKALAGVLLGSITEELIRKTTVPLVAVKRKGTGMSVIDALLNL